MKKIVSGFILASVLVITALPAYAANIQIQVDGVVIPSDTAPELKNNRTMVPLRVISEHLGAKVDWSKSEIILTKNETRVVLQPGSDTAVINGQSASLDAKTYINNNRTMVPLRFLAEAFGCEVNYSNATVAVDSPALVIDGVEVKALQYEYHMTMGGVVQQLKVNAYNQAIYDVLANHRGSNVEAPAYYSWMYTIDTLGSYYKGGQYDFLNPEGESIQQYDLYTLINTFPADMLEGYPKVLLHDVTENQWYLFDETAKQSIHQWIDAASQNGFFEVISNTVV